MTNKIQIIINSPKVKMNTNVPYMKDKGITISKEKLENKTRFIDLGNEEQKTNHNTKVVSSFIDHCKQKGIEIPDSAFESFFNA